MNRRGMHVLKWEGHLENINDLFQRLYIENNLVDVTLACKEGSIKAHKLVLTACSPFFERVLLENPCTHPVLIMRGVKLNHMQKLTSFMYKGSLEVQPDDLNSLLRTGEDLEIRGITEIKSGGKKRKADTATENFNIKNEVNGSCRDTRYKGKKRVAVDHSPLRESSSSPEVINPKFDSAGSPQKPKIVQTKTVTEEIQKKASSDLNDIVIKKEKFHTDTDAEELGSDTNSSKAESVKSIMDKSLSEPDQDNLLVPEKALLPCAFCCKPFENEESLQLHIAHMHTKRFQCDMCTISFNRTSHLERHRRTHTGERPFRCNLCERDFSRQDKLRQHLRNSHEMNSSVIGKSQPEPVDVESDSQWEIGVDVSMDSIGTDGKKKRGRPRKYPPKIVDPFAEKRKRGRPRKLDSDNGQSTYSGASQRTENYDIMSLPYGDFNLLMMTPHDTEYSVIEPIVDIVPGQPDTQNAAGNNEAPAMVANTDKESPTNQPLNNTTVTADVKNPAENNLVESVRKIGECTIRAVPPTTPCSLIV